MSKPPYAMWVQVPGGPHNDGPEWMTEAAEAVIIDGNTLTIGQNTFVYDYPTNTWTSTNPDFPEPSVPARRLIIETYTNDEGFWS